MQQSLQTFLNARESELHAQLAQLNAVRALLREIPDLKLLEGFDGKEILAAASFNASVTHIRIARDCTLAYRAWLWAHREGDTIFSDPPSFELGFKNINGPGIYQNRTWPERMRQASIPENIIQEVARLTAQHPADEIDM